MNHRRNVADWYYAGIKNLCVTLPIYLPRENNVYHLFPILSSRRDALQAYLREKGVQTLIHYPIPPYLQECYQEAVANGVLVIPKSGLPTTNQIHEQELSLPIGPTITATEVEQVINAVNSFI